MRLKKGITQFMEKLIEIYDFITSKQIFTTVFLVIVLLVVWFFAKMIFRRIAKRLLFLFTELSDEETIEDIAKKSASIVAVTLVLYINQLLPSFSHEMNVIFETVARAFIIINIASLLNNALDIFNIRHAKKHGIGIILSKVILKLPKLSFG